MNYGRTKISGLLAGVLILGAMSCARQPADTAVHMKGWNLPASEVAREYDRVKGPGTFAGASLADRESFARTLADKEILLRFARRQYPRLDEAHARTYRAACEKELQREFFRVQRESFHLAPAEVARQLPLVSREARVRLVYLASRGALEQVRKDQQAGMSFEEIAGRYGRGASGRGALAASSPPESGSPRWREVTVRADDARPSYPLAAQALLRDLPEGGVSEPFETLMGVMVAQVVSYRPLPEASDSLYQDKAKKLLDAVGYMHYYQTWVDSLRTAARFAFHPQAYPIVTRHFAAFWDSVDAAETQGASIDREVLRPPLGRFSAEERNEPIYDLWGKTHTVGEYVTSLNDVALDYWPTKGSPERLAFQIEGRITRLLYAGEAAKTGLTRAPEMVRRFKLREEEALLDQFRNGLSAQKAAPSAEEIRAEYEKAPDRYLQPVGVSFSALRYPAGKDARVRAFLRRVRAAGSQGWMELAPQEHQADSTVQFLPPTALMDAAGPAPSLALAPFMQAARGMEPGQVSEPIHSPTGIGLVWVKEKRPQTQLSLEQVTPKIRARLEEAKKDSLVEAMLTEGRKTFGVTVYPARLGSPRTAKP